MIPDPRAKPTLSVPEAAPLLGISRRLTYAAALAGEIPSLRFGGRVVIPTAALLALLGFTTDSSEAGPATGPAIAHTTEELGVPRDDHDARFTRQRQAAALTGLHLATTPRIDASPPAP